ncbi:hypothetical protein [Nocardia sp. A7]|uniref:hypothetical protein n=1 Tax=Nocardia sp. A7 TaxID=2789274 RepID=UPI00397CA0BE
MDEAGFEHTPPRPARAVSENEPTEPDAARRSTGRPTPGDEQAAIDLVRRKLRSMPADLDRTKATRRLVDMLARRGYSPATAFAIVKAELSQAQR